MVRIGLILSLATVSQAALVEVWYNISYATANPDKVFPRRVVGVNGTWPPPILNVNVGDTVRVHAFNGLDEGTALHHHGMFFNGSSYYDGAPGVTQCAIPVGQSLTYEIPVNDQWGTYWWHSHVGGQYVDGLRAPFLIHPAVEVHTYDEEFTVILGDWYHEQHSILTKRFLSVFNPSGAEPVPEYGLMYFAQNGTYLPGFNEDTGLTFVPGKTYRLRIINTSAFGMYFFHIDGHQMRVIEADGTDTEEYPIDVIGISAAQRYSVLVTALNETNLNWGIHANYNSDMFDVVPEDLQLNYTSTLTYAAGNPLGEESYPDSAERTPDHLLVPSIVEPQLTATRKIELGVWFATFDNGVNRAAFNNITYQFPKTPTLFTQLSMGENSTDMAVYGPQTHAIMLNHNEVVDLQIINWDAGNHPFHLHGHKYQIVRVAADVSSDDPLLNPPHTENHPNPMRTDTITIPSGGAVNIRFVADNPGTWMLHCHIEWHLESGLAVVFIEAPIESQKTLKLPPVMIDQCAAQNIPATGNVVGLFSRTNTEGAPYGPFPQVFGWFPRGIAALAGTILAALLGMATVVWYAIGGQLDEEEVLDEVKRGIEKKKNGGLIRRNVVAGWKAMKKQ